MCVCVYLIPFTHHTLGWEENELCLHNLNRLLKCWCNTCTPPPPPPRTHAHNTHTHTHTHARTHTTHTHFKHTLCEIRVTLPGEGYNSLKAALPIPITSISACSMFVCWNNGMAQYQRLGCLKTIVYMTTDVDACWFHTWAARTSR